MGQPCAEMTGTVSELMPQVQDQLFRQGVALLALGQRLEALECWFEAVEQNRDNLVYRKQIWQLLNPERFDPEVDCGWQREQREREETTGLREANPIPENF